RRLLRAAAKRAVASAKQHTPTTLKGPVTIEVDVSSDAVNDPAVGQRLKDNLSFLDNAFSDEEASKPMSDFEVILRNNPDLKGSKDGTIVIETANFTDGYVALHRALGSIYERDIENMIDLSADVQGYARKDIGNVLGDDYPITEVR
ncbi:MAG TPA: hypothetical protein VK090_01750, partial [Paracoccaceae bacterium]|nr:hypothetical protein [Paracoccaceae bacterium]